MSYETDLRTAIRRLEKSDTRIKRRNARRHLRTVLGRVRRELEAAYPLVQKNGQDVKAKKKPRCPVCGVPCKSWLRLAEHLKWYHKLHQTVGDGILVSKCWCGRSLKIHNFASHLAHTKDLQAHMLLGGLRKVREKLS